MIKVLLADEEKEFNEILGGYLRKEADMSVLGMTSDGLEALEMVERQKPDVVVLGSIMPKLDGLGVLERINQMEKKPKVIMLTNIRSSYYVQRAFDNHATDVLLKPFDDAGLGGTDSLGRQKNEAVNTPLGNNYLSEPPKEAGLRNRGDGGAAPDGDTCACQGLSIFARCDSLYYGRY